MKRLPFSKLILLVACIFSLQIYANTARVLKLGAKNRAILSFDEAPALEAGQRFVLVSYENDVADRFPVEIVKIKGRKAIVRYPNNRNLRVNESFEMSIRKKGARIPERKRDRSSSDDDASSSSNDGSPIKFGFEVGGSYGKDMGGIEAGATDYSSKFSWVNWLIGAALRYEIPNSPWGVQSGLVYAQRSYDYALTVGSDVNKLQNVVGNIEVPLLAVYKMKISDDAAFVPGIGLNMIYGIGNVTRTTETNNAVATTTETRGVSYKEAGLSKYGVELALKTGLDYKFKKFTAFGDFKINWGITDRNTGKGSQAKKALTANLSGGLLF